MESTDNFSFAELFEQTTQVNMKIKTGDKVVGKVFQIGRDNIFVDLGGRQDGVIDVKEFTDSTGAVTVKEGDEIQAFVAGSDADGIRLRRHIGGRAVQQDGAVAEAFAGKIPIEGKVTGERKGGFTVKVASIEAFCPFSQMDLRGVRRESSEYIGNSYQFLVAEYSEDGGNCVLSRRRLLDEQAAVAREKLLANLQEGDVLEGTVSSIMPYGAFVDLGGVEGMVHVSELSWDRGVRPEDVVKSGQRVQVRVLSYEAPTAESKGRPRIALSVKQAAGDPWNEVAEKFPVGTKVTGTVTRLMDFGAFVLLAPGVEGLVHISQLGADHRVEHPSEVVKSGEEVAVTILGVDVERHRISLCIGEPAAAAAPVELTVEQEKEMISAEVAGQTIQGEVESIRPFGIFVKLPSGQSGLLHVSQLEIGGDHAGQERRMARMYPLHSTIQVVVKEIKGDRISLTTPARMESESEDAAVKDIRDAGSASFGGLGDLFGGLKL